jgi:hypothetical protein
MAINFQHHKNNFQTKITATARRNNIELVNCFNSVCLKEKPAAKGKHWGKWKSLKCVAE